jgi:hypothetical protein
LVDAVEAVLDNTGVFMEPYVSDFSMSTFGVTAL